MTRKNAPQAAPCYYFKFFTSIRVSTDSGDSVGSRVRPLRTAIVALAIRVIST